MGSQCFLSPNSLGGGVFCCLSNPKSWVGLGAWPACLTAALPAGPFLGILLAKLENMLQNSLYVNFLLTGLLAQLACYPQPLLRSFLLNTNMVFQPSIKSLLQVAPWQVGLGGCRLRPLLAEDG